MATVKKKAVPKKAVRKKPSKSTLAMTNSVKMVAAASKLPQVPITKVVTDNFVDYGMATLLERAIPDFRDGLKPVHRRLVWAAYAKGILPSKSYSKCATIVGECMGHYHPVGDQAIYGALVTLINSVVPLFQAEGNLGNPALGIKPAQMRYPEARLSQESVDWLLDPAALAVTDMIPNFDSSKEEPVVLPARLPLVLINGASGISVGATTEIPTFHADSLIKLLSLAVTREGYTVTADECAKTLKLISRDGGTVLSSKKELAAVWEAGHGIVRWRCDYTTDAKAKTVTITGFSPGWARAVLDKIREMATVKHVHDLSSSGRLRIEIALKPSAIRGSDFEAQIEPILKKLESRITYRLNSTERWREEDSAGLPEVKAKFYSNGIATGLPGMIAKWLEWRVDVVRKVAGYHKKQFADKRRREEVLLLAINSLTEITKILTSTTTRDKRAAIAKKLKITGDEADIIWNTPIGRFDRMSSADQKKKIAELTKREKSAAADEKRPAKATERDLLTIKAPEPNSQSYTPRNSGSGAKKKRASRRKEA